MRLYICSTAQKQYANNYYFCCCNFLFAICHTLITHTYLWAHSLFRKESHAVLITYVSHHDSKFNNNNNKLMLLWHLRVKHKSAKNMPKWTTHTHQKHARMHACAPLVNGHLLFITIWLWTWLKLVKAIWFDSKKYELAIWDFM